MSNFKKEVYIAYGLDNEVLYVGQGNIGRSSHCYSGASHNKHLNRYYFLNGEEGAIRTEIFAYTNCEKDAVKIEVDLIKELSPICNSNHQATPDIIKRPNFTRNSEDYYNLYLEMLGCADSERFAEIKTQMSSILELNRYLCTMLGSISIEDIKNTSFNKTKSKKKYNKAVGISDIVKSKSLSKKNLKISTGDFLTYAEIKGKIQKCFDENGINSIAKATDIKLLFNVKRTARKGAEGFVIGERIKEVKSATLL